MTLHNLLFYIHIAKNMHVPINSKQKVVFNGPSLQYVNGLSCNSKLHTCNFLRFVLNVKNNQPGLQSNCFFIYIIIQVCDLV